MAILLGTASTGYARPAHKQALAEYFGPFLARKLNDCRTCHLPDAASADSLPSDKPHNPFGARLKAIKSQLRKAGKPFTIPARLEAIADEDSDGDGVANILEILSGHFPGDPKDKPTGAELVAAEKTLAEFRRSKTGYPWTPFERLKRPAVPAVKDTAWNRNPIDAFIAAEHERHGLTPGSEANRPTLLRRVYLDVIGLPPTPSELHEFVADPAPDFYEKVVDRLLDRTQYGERWGRHWMDIWRYSDWAGWSDGGQIRDSQPHIWRWRDWIVESLNKDKGYDRMILEMLAADELAPEDTDALRATGYLVRNYKMLSREKWMQDTVDHTFLAFQAVTLGCARCHDHMYDPILQKEYYQVRAIFEPHQVRIDRIPGEPDVKKDGLVHVYDANPTIPTYLFIRGDDRTPDKHPLSPAVPELLSGAFTVSQPIRLPLTVSMPDRRDFVVREDLAASEARAVKLRASCGKSMNRAEVSAATAIAARGLSTTAFLVGGWQALNSFILSALDARLAASQHAALVAVVETERLEDAGNKDSSEWRIVATATYAAQRQAALLQAHRDLLAARMALAGADGKSRREASKRVQLAETALARSETQARLPASTNYTKRAQATFPTISTGRRLALARWLASRDNPLTARVAVNHIWLRHFGQAIVPSVFDFGRNGRPPFHPALLDWLAVELMERGWSMKALHRLILTSNTYRMAATFEPANVIRDRDNLYLWRMNSRRMEAEVVRDCIYYVAGRLDLAMGGPDLDHSQGLAIPRRSIYFRYAAEKQMEFLKLFDCASVTECYQRKDSVLPQQALALANSELTLRHARLLAAELTARAGEDPTEFTRAAFERVLSRLPSAQESAECQTFLIQQATRYAKVKATTSPHRPQPVDGMLPSPDASQRARENLVHVLLNHNDFVTVR
jgi:hypothetical protein